MLNFLVIATVPVGLAASAAWTAYLAYELFGLVASLFY
jgi:hypothetical protein